MSLLLPILPLFLQEIGVKNHTELSLWNGAIFSVTFLVSAICSPFWGWLADKFGQKKNLTRIGLGMGLLTLLMSFSESPISLFILRALLGVFSGFQSVSLALQAKTTPNDQVGRALGFLNSGVIIGYAVGPLVGGGFASYFGIRPTFAVMGGLILITTLPIYFFINEELNEIPKIRKKKERKFLFLIENHLWVFMLCSFVTSFAMMSTSSVISIFINNLKSNHENLIFFTTFAASLYSIASLIGSVLFGKLADKFGHIQWLTTCILFSSLGIFMIPVIDNLLGVYIGRSLQGVFIAPVIPAIVAILKIYSSEEILGRVTGLNQTFNHLGNLFGPMVASLMAGYLSTEMVFFFSASLFLLMGGMLIVFKRRIVHNTTGSV